MERGAAQDATQPAARCDPLLNRRPASHLTKTTDRSPVHLPDEHPRRDGFTAAIASHDWAL